MRHGHSAEPTFCWREMALEMVFCEERDEALSSMGREQVSSGRETTARERMFSSLNIAIDFHCLPCVVCPKQQLMRSRKPRVSAAKS